MEERKLCGFISYSHKDIKMKEKLQAHMTVLRKKYNINIWHDGCINAGQPVDKLVMSYLNRADIVFVLVSADYLHSYYCCEVELKQAIYRHKNKQCVVIPIILKPVSCLRDMPFGDLLMVPQDAKPIAKFSPRDEGYAISIKMIDKVISDWFNLDAQSKDQSVSNDRDNYQQAPYPEKYSGDNSISYVEYQSNDQNQIEAVAVNDSLDTLGFNIYQNGNLKTYPATQAMINRLPVLCERIGNLSAKLYQFNDEQLEVYKKDYRKEFKPGVHSQKEFKPGNHCTSDWWNIRVKHYLQNCIITIGNELLHTDGVRIHMRKVEYSSYIDIVAAELSRNDYNLVTNLTPIPENNSMISAANRLDAPLIKSFNMDYHHTGVNDDKWIDYLTCVFKKLDSGLQPILTLGISINGDDYESKRDLLILFAHVRIDNIIQSILLDYCSKCRQIDSGFDLKRILDQIK